MGTADKIRELIEQTATIKANFHLENSLSFSSYDWRKREKKINYMQVEKINDDPEFMRWRDELVLSLAQLKKNDCNGVQREHNKKLNNGLPILHKVPPKRDYGRYFCIMAEKGGTSHGGLTEKLSLFFHAKKQEVNAYGR